MTFPRATLRGLVRQYGGLCLLLAIVGVMPLFVLGSTTGTMETRADAEESITFAVIGDFGQAGPNEQAVATLVASWSPAFVITTGDNNYPSGEASTIDRNIGQYYHGFIAPYGGAYGDGAATNRFFPSLGNHDWLTGGAAPYLAYFSLPGNERYYDVDRGPVHLFAIDSDPHEPDGVTSTSQQAAWLRHRLATSAACWKLVYFHHAPYSSGPHGPNVGMQWPFREWGADGVLSGHDHTYERLVVGGLPYFVNGLGGNTPYAFKTPIAGSVVRYNAGHGAMRVTASRTTITYEFVATDGTVIDSYTEAGSCAPPSTPTPTRGGTGQLRVTVTATGQGGPLRAIRFEPARHAEISTPGGPAHAPGGFEVTLPSGLLSYSFTVQRTDARQAVHVPFVVVDACGDWTTFVGGGAGSF